MFQTLQMNVLSRSSIFVLSDYNVWSSIQPCSESNSISGHYIYLEASKREISDAAILESPVFPPLPVNVLDPGSIYNESCKVHHTL